MTEQILAGACRSCGGDLVQVVGVETYHPAVSFGGSCPDLLMIPGTEGWNPPAYSLRVPTTSFVLDTDGDSR